jgi:hypothetical protein
VPEWPLRDVGRWLDHHDRLSWMGRADPCRTDPGPAAPEHAQWRGPALTPRISSVTAGPIPMPVLDTTRPHDLALAHVGLVVGRGPVPGRDRFLDACPARRTARDRDLWSGTTDELVGGKRPGSSDSVESSGASRSSKTHRLNRSQLYQWRNRNWPHRHPPKLIGLASPRSRPCAPTLTRR